MDREAGSVWSDSVGMRIAALVAIAALVVVGAVTGPPVLPRPLWTRSRIQ